MYVLCVCAYMHICMPQYTRGSERTNLGELVPSFNSVDSGDQTQGLGDKHPLSHLIAPLILFLVPLPERTLNLGGVIQISYSGRVTYFQSESVVTTAHCKRTLLWPKQREALIYDHKLQICRRHSRYLAINRFLSGACHILSHGFWMRF